MTIVDCRGLSCPEPVILTKKALKNNSEVEVLVDNRVPLENITRFSRAMGIEPVVEEGNGEWKMIIKK